MVQDLELRMLVGCLWLCLHTVCKLYVFYIEKKESYNITLDCGLVHFKICPVVMEVICMFLEKNLKRKIGPGKMFRPEFVFSEPVQKPCKSMHLSF